MRDSNGVETNRVVNGKVAVPSSVTDGKFFSIQIYGKRNGQLVSTNKLFVDQT